MDRITSLKERVLSLYQAKNPNRVDWADWLCANHVFVVADMAGELAQRKGADISLAMAAGMLHDVADTIMKRDNPQHEEESLRIAKNLLTECGFTPKEINIVEDALIFHSCRDGKIPHFPEGKIMATADALAHLKTDFYQFAYTEKSKNSTHEQIKSWALPKIERDFVHKIFFEDVREQVRPKYEELKTFFENT